MLNASMISGQMETSIQNPIPFDFTTLNKCSRTFFACCNIVWIISMLLWPTPYMASKLIGNLDHCCSCAVSLDAEHCRFIHQNFFHCVLAIVQTRIRKAKRSEIYELKINILEFKSFIFDIHIDVEWHFINSKAPI